ncbi:MAG: methyl-accepting chemotaxis protein [Glycocaulis sp.]
MTRLDSVRNQSQRALLAALGAFVPVFALAALFTAPERLIAGTGFLALVAAGCFAVWRSAPQSLATRLSLASGLIAFPAALTWLASGTSWQIDMHMVFFAMLAAATVLCDWRALLAAAAVTAVHHLAFNFLLPFAVFPDGADFLRVVFHAVIVVGQTAALTWLCVRIVSALDSADTALSEAGAANTEARRLAEADHQRQKQMEEGRATVNALATGFEKTVAEVLDEIRAASARMDALAADLRNDAGATREGAEEASSRVRETSGHFESVAAAAQELAASISEVSRIMENTDSVSGRAVEEAGRASQSMGELDEAGKEVQAIADLVAGIAEQTNLLALNATIEAARAGEAGKGFAVVASEVKALADQTARATGDIRSKIEAMSQAPEGASEALERIAGIIEEMRSASSSARGAFGEQSGATGEIAQLAQRAAQATSGIDARISEVNTAAGRTGEAAGRFAGASQSLREAAGRLDSELAGFREALKRAS